MTSQSLRVFLAKIDLWLDDQIWHKLYLEASIGTSVFLLNIDILWKYITKDRRISMCTCCFPTLAMPEKTKFSKLTYF